MKLYFTLLFTVLFLGSKAQTIYPVHIDSIYTWQRHSAAHNHDTVTLILKDIVTIGTPLFLDSFSSFYFGDTILIKRCYWTFSSTGWPHNYTDSIPLGVFQPGTYNVQLYLAVTHEMDNPNCAGAKRRDTVDVSFTVPALSSVATEHLSSIKVFPNPFGDELKIETALPANFQLLNRQGQVMLEERLDSQTILNTSLLPAGFYVLRIQSKEELLIRKVIKF